MWLIRDDFCIWSYFKFYELFEFLGIGQISGVLGFWGWDIALADGYLKLALGASFEKYSWTTPNSQIARFTEISINQLLLSESGKKGCG